MKVLITDPISETCVDILQRKGLEVSLRPGLSAVELLQAIDGYDALIVRSRTQVTAEVIVKGTKLKVIGRAGEGVDNVDVRAATARGIAVMNAPGANTITVAEHTMALVLALARQLPQAHQSLKEGRWERARFMGVELYDKILGIIGLGKIGREVALRARAFGMKVQAYDPLIAPNVFVEWKAEPVALDSLLRTSDYISLHVPLNEQTRNLLGRRELALCKKGARIVNTARGRLIDEEALYEAIVDGRIAGAAFDVFSEEPPKHRALLMLDSVVVTPHIGAATYEAQERVAAMIGRFVADYLCEGKTTMAIVNPEILSR